MRLFSAAASGQKSHLPSGASKVSWTSLRQLKKFPDVPVSTREEHRGSRHNSRKPVSPPPPERRVRFPALSGKGILAFPSHLKRRRSQLDTREELQGYIHLFRRPRCPNALQIHLTPLHLTRRSPRGPTQNTMAGVTALWHLERKPPIPISTQQEI